MPLTPALTNVLRGGRAEFNRRFALAQQRYPGLDAAAFSALLAGPINTIVERVGRVDSGAIPALVDTLYDTSLALLGQRWIGPGGRASALLSGWELLAEHAPALVAQQPQALIISIANALSHWSAHGGGDDWLLTLTELASRARNPDDLLRAGQIAAWRHGLAHYRSSALERARSLDRELLALALSVTPEDWDESMLVRLNAERWYRPDQPDAAAAPRVVGQVGAFVGFGGRFEEPPLAGEIGGELLLDSGSARFSLYADAYGANVQAHGDGQLLAAQRLPKGWRIDGGTLIGPDCSFGFEDRGAITSAAHSADTLVLTHAWSHAATLVALG
jgi:hypothetical protein